MTIVKRGSGFRVVSEKGKNLGDEPSKAAAVKRLKQVEWFKHHAKCIVDPSLVKGTGMEQYVPVIFNVAKPKDKEAQKLDFPSTTKQLELKDVKQPEFPSTPFTGEAYAQSFHNPRPSNNVKDGTHVSVQGDGPAPQGPSPFRGEHGPDTQFKGSDYVPKKAKKSLMIAGRKVIIKSTQGSDNENLRGYPIDKDKGEPINQYDESQKRKDWLRSEKVKDDVKAHEQAKKNYAPGNGPFDLAMDTKTAYLGRSKEKDLEKGAIKVLGTAIKQTVKDSMDKEKRAEEKKKIAALTATVKKSKSDKPIGEYTKEYPGAKVTFDQPIDPTKKPKKVFVHLTERGRDVKAKRTEKSGGIMKFILQYTQNQPLAAGFKPLLAHLVTNDDDDEENLKGPKLAKKAMSSSDVYDRIARTRDKNKPVSPKLSRLSSRAAKVAEDSSGTQAHDDAAPIHPGVDYKNLNRKSIDPKSTPFRDKDGNPLSFTTWPGRKKVKKKTIESTDRTNFNPDTTQDLDRTNWKSSVSNPIESIDKAKKQTLKEFDAKRVKEIAREATKHLDLRTRTKPAGKPEPKGGGKTWSHKIERSSRPNPFEGGKGDDLEYDDVDPAELEAGIDVEQEHVGDNPDMDEDEKRIKGADIAMDHLAEDEQYYTKLKEMERTSKEGAKAETKKQKLLKLGSATKSTKVINLADYRKKRLEEKKGDYPRPYSVTRAEHERALEVRAETAKKEWKDSND